MSDIENTTNTPVTEERETITPVPVEEPVTTITEEPTNTKPKKNAKSKKKSLLDVPKTDLEKMTKAELIQEIHNKDEAFKKLEADYKKLGNERNKILETSQKLIQDNLKTDDMLCAVSNQLHSIANLLMVINK
jgi:uncharacterized protein YpuA (DUF1002 family)